MTGRRGMSRTLFALGWVLLLSGLAPELRAQTEPVTVTFELNDAQVKDQRLEGVEVRVLAIESEAERAAGTTGPDGRWTTSLVSGAYRVAYRKAGYVAYTSGATEIVDAGQLVVVSLSRLLEAESQGARQVRIILNWGSRQDQVRDADSHLACPCGEPTAHVYYQNKLHEGASHRVELDVDDTDWGGPETITLKDPKPGSYLYWVHDYSGPPAVLGASDAVVRVVIGDQESGEFRVLKGVDRRAWRPFREIQVAADGTPTVVRFSEDEIAEGADLEVPNELQPADQQPDSAPPSAPSDDGTAAAVDRGLARVPGLVLAAAIVLIAIRALRGARRRR
jgi:hypothetical protein